MTWMLASCLTFLLKRPWVLSPSVQAIVQLQALQMVLDLFEGSCSCGHWALTDHWEESPGKWKA